MSTIYDENFDSFAAGSGYSVSGGLSGVIVAGGADPSPLRSFRSNPSFGGIQFDLPDVGDISIFLSYRIVPGLFVQLQWFNGTVYAAQLQLTAELDGSLSVSKAGGDYFTDGGGHVVNTMVQNGFAWCPGEWVFIHLHAAFTAGTINVDLAVNQIAAASGSHTGYGGTVSFQRFIYQGPNSTLVDNITVKDSDDTLPHPAPEVPPGSGLFPSMYGRMAQFPFEHVDLPDDAPVRLSQAVLERLDLPDDERVRLSQAVIELIQKNTTPPPQLLPQYIKRRTLLAN